MQIWYKDISLSLVHLSHNDENKGISLQFVCPLLVAEVMALPPFFLKMLIPSPNT